MKRLRRTAAAALAAALLLAMWALPAQGARHYDACAKDYKTFSALTRDVPADVSLIVKTDGTLPDLRATHPVRSIQGPDDTYVVLYESEEAADAALGQMETQRGVDWAEINVPVYAQEQTASVSDEAVGWGYEYIHADVLNARVREAAPTERVTVAVVDSGVLATHPVFEGRNIGGTSMIAAPYDEDGSGHGTSVSGIIAECTEGLPVDLMEVRILNDRGEGTSANAAAGIRYAAENGADVLNLSFGAEKHVQTLDDAVADALECGCLPVISAGNYGCDLDVKPICPSHDADGFVVSGCATDDSLYKKTCFGSTVDVCAPAVNLRCANLSGGYSTKSGTSFAAPYAAAAAAMLKLLAPDANVQMLEYLLKTNVRDLGDAGFDAYYGYGVLDLHDVQLPQQTLTLDAAGGVFADGASAVQKTLAVGARVKETAAPKRDGFAFKGYLPEVPTYMPFDARTCTALWAPESEADAVITERREPTCTESGYVVFSTEEPLTVSVPATGHNYSDWKLSRAATQYAYGEEKSFCTRCGDVRTRTIEQLPTKELTLKATKIRLRYQTTYDLAPSETVTWIVDDESVARVTVPGIVEAVGKGTTTVTAVSADGKKTASCDVTVYYAWWQWLIRIFLAGWLWY